MPDKAHHICLVGGGHAHLAVLADWIERGLPCRSATLLTPHPTLRYSGMVPGWVSGQYDRDAGLVDIAALAERAGVHLVLDRCVGLDPAKRAIAIGNGGEIAFDIASFDTGGVGRARKILGDDRRLIDIRPIDRFVTELEERMPGLGALPRLAVVGGGAGGVEIAFALRNAALARTRPEVVLVAGSEGLLPGFARAVRQKVICAFADQRIEIVMHDARFEGGALVADGRSLEPLDLVVAAVGSGAPDWPGASGLAVDEAGFIAVDEHQRSISHPHIYAVGDVASRQDRRIAHSGVHAVKAGPVLAANLRASAKGYPPLRSYRPRPWSLYLISTGDGSAIASYGPLAARGRWVSRLKHRIDTRWIEKYARLGGKV